ncbi:MAG: TonB-dependent receptor [Bacteroidales bacterium]|nr:TonB-dependent receptor [Bacteroidales bacterium]
MRIVITLSLFLFFASIAMDITAQGVFKGKVIDSKTKVALVGASLKLDEIATGTITDGEGKFSFENLKFKSYVLLVKYQGYYDVVQKINVESFVNQEIIIEMRLNIRELTTVEIRDDKIVSHPYSKQTISRVTLSQEPVRDIGDFLRSIPNVSAIRKGGANLDPVIRGFKFDQLNVQVDNGLSMEGGCPNRMDPTSAHVEASDIEAIEIYKGPFALRYGPVMGGVINMLTINPRPYETFSVFVKGNMGYESNWNGMRQHVTVLGGNQKIFFALTGNDARYGNYSDGDGSLVKSDFRKMGFTGKLGYAPAKNHRIIFSASKFYARDVAFTALPMDERTDNTSLYSLDYQAKNISNTISSLEFKAYASLINHVMDNNERPFGDTTSSIAAIDALKYGYRAEAGLNIAKGHLFVGTDFYRVEKDGQRDKIMLSQFPMQIGLIPLKVENLWNQAVITNLGLFGEYKREWTMWEMVVAIRGDFNQAYSDSISLLNMMGVDLLGTPADSTSSELINFSFSAGVTRNISEFFTLGASFGRGVRSPGMIERFIVSLPTGYDNFEYIGNPNLKPEANNEFDLVLRFNKSQIGAAEFTVFYSFIQDYIGGEFIPKTIQKPLTQSVLGVKRFENLGNANLAGFEFGYNSPTFWKMMVKFSGAYTFGAIKEIEVLEFDANGNAINAEMVSNDPIAELPPFEAKLSIGYKLFDMKWIPKADFRYVAEQNRVSEASLEPVSPSFYLINVSMTYRFSDYLDVACGINNLLDTEYTEHLNRRVVGTDYRIPEPGRILYLNVNYNF